MAATEINTFLPGKLNLTMAIAPMAPRIVATSEEPIPNRMLVRTAPSNSKFFKSCWYHWRVKPLSGKTRVMELLNEKITSKMIGKKRMVVTSQKYRVNGEKNR